MEEYKTLMHRWFEEVWNQGREETIDELFAEDGVGYGLPTEDGEPIRGAKEFKPFYHKFREAFPDIHVTIEETVCEDDKITALCHVTGTHSGNGVGVKPTNQPIDFKGIVIIKVKDGKIVESWNQFDFLSMYQQLGALNLMLNA